MTVHAVFTGDLDKTICGVRISHKAERKAALLPHELTCDVCSLKVLRRLKEEFPHLLADALVALDRWPEGVGGA